MNQEIKFRGQRKDNGKWVEGKSYCNLAGLSYIAEYSQGEGRNVDGKIISGWIQVSPKTVGQFIGREGKNGQEIYEGDIVLGDDNNYEVIWENERARFNIKKWYNGSQECETCAFSEQFCHEVIGNIHENPELLKGESQ